MNRHQPNSCQFSVFSFPLRTALQQSTQIWRTPGSGELLQNSSLTDNRQLTTDNYLAHRNIPITIIGGGIHGVSIALRLLREVPTAVDHLAIVDRHPHPLTQWRYKTERQGMMFLRSPAVHHITPDALGIVEYAERHNRTDELVPPYAQPSTQTLLGFFCKDALSSVGGRVSPARRIINIYYQFEVAKLRWDKGGRQNFPFSTHLNEQ